MIGGRSLVDRWSIVSWRLQRERWFISCTVDVHMPTSRPGARAIVLTDPNTRLPDRWGDARIVHTPLDLIVALDGPVEIVVLSGGFASEPAICGFLREHYPNLDIVAAVACAHVSRPRAFPRGSQCAIGTDSSGDAAGGEHTDSIEPGYS